MEATIAINGKDVAITGDESTLQQAIDSGPFRDWVDRLDKRFVVTAVEIQSVDLFGSHAGFVKWKADIADEAGNRLPGIVFGRGPAVAVLVLLACEGRDYVLLTNQARVPIGDFAHDELVAGMTDGDGQFVGVAAKEVREETGLELSKQDFLELSSDGVYSSPGGSDEYVRYYFYRQTVDRAYLDQLQGKLAGLREEGELITLKVMPLVEACMRVTDGKFWTAFGLYQAAIGMHRIY